MGVSSQLFSFLCFVAFVLVLMFLPLATVFGVFRFFRKGVATVTRRPFAGKYLREAGFSCRVWIAQIEQRVLLLVFGMLVAAAVVAESVVISPEPYTGRGGVGWIVAALWLLFAVYAGFRLYKALVQMEIASAQLDSEVAIGQELDLLMLQGAHVYHDIVYADGNIDHLVVSSKGVFSIESGALRRKSGVQDPESVEVVYDGSRLRFPAGALSDEAAQDLLTRATESGLRARRWLQDILGITVRVTPVLALPGWKINRTGAGGIRVFSGRALGRMLSCGSDAVPDALLRRINEQIVRAGRMDTVESESVSRRG